MKIVVVYIVPLKYHAALFPVYVALLTLFHSCLLECDSDGLEFTHGDEACAERGREENKEREREKRGRRIVSKRERAEGGSE